MTLRELSTGREYNTHNDRLFNGLFSGQKGLPETVRKHEPNANPEENLKEPEEDSDPVGNPEEALMRTRSGRVVRPRRDRNFDYTGVLLQFGFIPTSNTTCSLTSVYFFSTSDHILEPFSIDTCFAHAPLRAHANLGSMPLVQESIMRRGQRIRREQRARLENLGEKVYWVTDKEGVQQLMAIITNNGTLFQLDTALGDWVTLADGRALTNIQRTPSWPMTSGNRNLTDEQVAL